MCKQSKSNRKQSYILGTHFLGSLFVKANAYSYANVQRWTKDVPIFNAKTVLIPHCEHLHWTLFHIDIELKEIASLDSAFMGSNNEYCRMILRCAALFSSPSTSHDNSHIIVVMLIIAGRWLGDEFESKSGHADGHRQDASVPAQPKKKRAKQDLTNRVDESGRHVDDKFDASEWKIISPHNPMQTNGFDCGVFIVLFMDLLMLGVPLLFGAEDVSLMRKKLTLQILNARAESARKVVDVDVD